MIFIITTVMVIVSKESVDVDDTIRKMSKINHRSRWDVTSISTRKQ